MAYSAWCRTRESSLDAFFASVLDDAQWLRGISDRAFAQARARLHMPALEWLNERLLARVESLDLVPRWRGLRVVAADASVLMPAIRRCARTRGLAGADQRLFALYLPGAELTLHAAVHSAQVSERAMLMEALPLLAADDMLVLDRGYPAAWLVQSLSERGVRFVMRCDLAGWSAMRHFIRSGLSEAMVTLKRPSVQDAADWGCQRSAPTVRLVRQVAPNGQVRVLATNLSSVQAPVDCFAALYHQRWRIEEAFKRLKHVLRIEAVSGLTQQALIIDVAAKVLADNIASLMTRSAMLEHRRDHPTHHANRRHAASLLERALPAILLFIGDVLGLIDRTLRLIANSAQRYRPDRSCPRPPRRVKPHPHCAYKG